MRRMIMILAVALCSLSTMALAAATTIAGFDGGSDDGFTGNAYFESTGGNPGGVASHVFDGFFIDLRTGGIGEPANENFLGDFSTYARVTFSFDVKTNSLTDFMGNQIGRPIGIALKDHDITGPNGPSGVYFEMGVTSVSENGEWTTLSVTIDDPTSETLPAGWVGSGDEDPSTYMPILPAGATFASVLAGVDEFSISGAVPGYFFTYAYYDVLIDNVSVMVDGGSVATEASTLSSLKAMFR